LSKPRDKGLSQYRKKRDPSKTTEPFEAEPAHRVGATKRGRFVVHCHDASRLHYDLRLQIGGVLESFAVPKGPSLRLDDRRLAVHTEAHPLRYLDFEGVIPEGNYGAGAMIVWDRGRVSYPRDTAEEGLEKGALSFELDGFKLKGRFSLVRPTKQDGKQDQWLLIKRDDAFASDEDVSAAKPRSVLSGMTVQDLGDAERLYEEALGEAKAAGAKRGVVQASRLTPMLCTLEDVPVDRADWIYELKLDGVRILADRSDNEARLFYRTRRPATASFPEVVEALKTLLAADVLLDGEIVAFDEQGLPSFQKLGSRIHARRAGDIRLLRDAVPVVFVVFDILRLGEYDLREIPLFKRKALLNEVVLGGAGVIRTLDYFEDDGRALLSFCEDRGLEGLVAKRRDAAYHVGPGRTGNWVKVKLVREDDFIASGHTAGKGSRKRLGALELASFQEGKLQPCGRVGSGLSDREIDLLLPRLEAGEPVVVRVRYAGWTEEGNLRHPVYLGMRNDVAPEEVVLAPKPDDATMLDDLGAAEAGADRVVGKARLTNQSKVFWPDDGITKGDLCDYYEAVAPVLLPHLRDRPVTLVRFPDGIEGKSFFQWRIPKGAPPWLQSLRLRSEEEDGKEVNTILVNDLSSLMYVANLGCIPLHIIASRAGALDTCDFLTLDLDVELASLETAIPIALTIRNVLEEVGLTGFPKTSGKTGLHVLVPLGDGLPFEVAKQLLELIARIVLQRHPEHATMERRKDKRGARVLLDVGQTGRHRTIVAPYSVREVPGAPVSTPLSWDEVSLSLDPSSFNLFTVAERVLSLGDPMVRALSTGLDLDETLAKLGELITAGDAT
jgi:bifunctional non-homologous end joining protein LigD